MLSSFIAFIFGFYHALQKAALLLSNQATYFLPIRFLLEASRYCVFHHVYSLFRDIGLILWAISSLLCCIGVFWYNKITENPTAVPLILHLFIPVGIFMILNLTFKAFYNDKIVRSFRTIFSYHTIRIVPVAMSAQPMSDFTVNVSCKK